MLEYSNRVVISCRFAVHDGVKGQVFVDERAIIVLLRWFLWNQRAISRSTLYLQISRWQFGAESSKILKFIALRVEARGTGPAFFVASLLTSRLF